MDVGIRTLSEQDINTLATSKQVQYGAVGVTEDGRRFRYVSFGGASTIASGQLLVASAVTANYQGLTITASGTGAQVSGNLSVGSTQIVLTNGSTAITADQFAEGFIDLLVCGSGTGVTATYTYRVRGNTAAAASGNITVLLAQSEPLQNTAALVAGTDTVNLIQNPYWAVVPNTSLAQVAGVLTVPYTYTSGYNAFAWVQVKGLTNVKVDSSTPAAGNGLSQSATSGTVGTTGVSGSAVIGVANSAKAGGAVSTVLNIAY